MYGNVVGGVLTVGVGQHSIEVCVERERAAAVGTQEQTTLVIVIGMEIVPEDWRLTEYRGQLFNGEKRYRLGDDLWTCTGVGVEQFRVFHSHRHRVSHNNMYIVQILSITYVQSTVHHLYACILTSHMIIELFAFFLSLSETRESNELFFLYYLTC